MWGCKSDALIKNKRSHPRRKLRHPPCPFLIMHAPWTAGTWTAGTWTAGTWTAGTTHLSPDAKAAAETDPLGAAAVAAYKGNGLHPGAAAAAAA